MNIDDNARGSSRRKGRADAARGIRVERFYETHVSRLLETVQTAESGKGHRKQIELVNNMHGALRSLTDPRSVWKKKKAVTDSVSSAHTHTHRYVAEVCLSQDQQRRLIAKIGVASEERTRKRVVGDRFIPPCGEDNGLELGRVSRRRVKIGLRLAGSHYNNSGAAGKLHASVPLTVSPG